VYIYRIGMNSKNCLESMSDISEPQVWPKEQRDQQIFPLFIQFQWEKL